MRKAVLHINETLRYRREVPMLIPDEMTESEFNDALDEAEQGAESAEDIIHNLRDFGIELAGCYDDSLDSPTSGEAECEDYDIEEASEECNE